MGGLAEGRGLAAVHIRAAHDGCGGPILAVHGTNGKRAEASRGYSQPRPHPHPDAGRHYQMSIIRWLDAGTRPAQPGVLEVLVPNVVYRTWARWTGEYWCNWPTRPEPAAVCSWRGIRTR